TRRTFATARHCYLDALLYTETVPLHLRV
ncbi:unnamed protein product, partial [Urochloa humidicola]